MGKIYQSTIKCHYSIVRFHRKLLPEEYLKIEEVRVNGEGLPFETLPGVQFSGESLTTFHKALASTPNKHINGMVVHTYTPRRWEVEASKEDHTFKALSLAT